MKNHRHTILRAVVGLVFLSPYILGFSPNPEDSSSTTIGVSIGGGSYSRVSRDCSGNVTGVTDYPYSDVGVSIDHKISAIDVGVKGGVANISSKNGDGTLKYINPNAGFDVPYLGLRVGALFTNDFGGHFFANNGFGGNGTYHYYGPNQFDYSYATVYPMGSIRIGYADSWYFTSGLCDNVPLLSGGGLFTMGLGFHYIDSWVSRSWFGVGFFPFDRPVFGTKLDIPVSDKVIINFQGNIHAGDATEYGFAIGTKIGIH